MVDQNRINTSVFIGQELDWLKAALGFRYFVEFAKQAPSYESLEEIPRPDPKDFPCAYTELILEYDLGVPARMALILALAPHIDPSTTEMLGAQGSETGVLVSDLGGIKVNNSSLVLPSGQTLVFILGGGDFNIRTEIIHLFDVMHPLAKEHLIDLGPVGPAEPMLFGVLTAKQELLDLVFSEKPRIPRFGPQFPAKVITSKLEWEDLVLDGRIFKQLEEIMTWLKYHSVLRDDWGMKRLLKPGYRALFYGPPGTGKTMCATLLGKYAQQEVFRIDLSMIVSKYIGETEKNLGKIFDAAERKNWILFFDEADALFGKRTNVQDSHDRYANQEVSYLLQRVEEYEGLVLLATNLRSNLDDAFTRRFQTIVHFPMPRQEERIQIWKRAIPEAANLGPDVDLDALSMQYELSGGSIVNAVHYACLQTVKEGTNVLSKRILIEAIRREYHKEGKTM